VSEQDGMQMESPICHRVAEWEVYYLELVDVVYVDGLQLLRGIDELMRL